MKDEFTAALSEVVQHQIELTSTVESILANQGCRTDSFAEIDAVRDMLAQFNATVISMTNRLAARYDEAPERPAIHSQTDASST